MDRARADELTDKLIAGTITEDEKEEMREAMPVLKAYEDDEGWN